MSKVKTQVREIENLQRDGEHRRRGAGCHKVFFSFLPYDHLEGLKLKKMVNYVNKVFISIL